MSDRSDPTHAIWQKVLAALTADDRITPQLHGFISLVEPKGVMTGTLYLGSRTTSPAGCSSSASASRS